MLLVQAVLLCAGWPAYEIRVPAVTSAVETQAYISATSQNIVFRIVHTAFLHHVLYTPNLKIFR